jgi:hypothetical protein
LDRLFQVFLVRVLLLTLQQEQLLVLERVRHRLPSKAGILPKVLCSEPYLVVWERA